MGLNLTLAAAVYLSASSLYAANTTVVVTSANPGPWALQHAACSGALTGSQAFVQGPPAPPAGTGSREFRIGSNGDAFETFRNSAYHGVKLSELTTLKYSTYISQNIDGQAAYLLLNIDFDNDGVVDDQIFFEPIYQSGSNLSLPIQGPVLRYVWQTWNALTGGWWSTSTSDVSPGTGVKSLAYYINEHPGARIINATSGAGGLRVAAGCGAGAWDNFIGNADNVQIGVNDNTTTYDFELYSVPSDKGQCKDGGWRLFNPPTGPFKNQGECVSYTNH